MSDEATITALIHRWAQAVHDGDLDAVLTDHSPDIVMFDVPPPDDGVRGLPPTASPGRPSSSGSAAERCSRSSSWRSPPAPTWRSRTRCCGAACRTNWREHPDRRLRLTIGLRKVDGRWVVTHEHHSFPTDD